MWQGVLQKPSEDVFQFVLKLISQAKRRSGGGGALSLEGIYKSLNRYEWNFLNNNISTNTYTITSQVCPNQIFPDQVCPATFAPAQVCPDPNLPEAKFA